MSFVITYSIATAHEWIDQVDQVVIVTFPTVFFRHLLNIPDPQIEIDFYSRPA